MESAVDVSQPSDDQCLLSTKQIKKEKPPMRYLRLGFRVTDFDCLLYSTLNFLNFLRLYGITVWITPGEDSCYGPSSTPVFFSAHEVSVAFVTNIFALCVVHVANAVKRYLLGLRRRHAATKRINGRQHSQPFTCFLPVARVRKGP